MELITSSKVIILIRTESQNHTIQKIFMLHKAANAPLRQDSVAKKIFLVLFMNIKTSKTTFTTTSR